MVNIWSTAKVFDQSLNYPARRPTGVRGVMPSQDHLAVLSPTAKGRGPWLCLMIFVTLAACVPPPEFVVFSPTTGDPLTRIENGTPVDVLTAGAAAIRDLGFEIDTPSAEAG